MGAFVVIIVTLLAAIWLALSPFGQDALQINPHPSRPAVQAVAANMIEFHQAAVNFVSMSANAAPASTRWDFTYLNQASVRCAPYVGASYTSVVPAGCTAPVTAFPMPGYLSDTDPAYDWVVCYQTGSPNIVVTYSRTGDAPGGYAPAEIVAALDDYNIEGNYTNWYWGVTAVGPALSQPSALTLPVTCTGTQAVGVGVIALATSIP